MLVYTGAIGVMQDFDNVLAAISQLRETHPDLYRRLLVLIVGGGVAAGSTRAEGCRPCVSITCTFIPLWRSPRPARSCSELMPA